MDKHIYLVEKITHDYSETSILEHFSKIPNTVILDSSLKSEQLGRYSIIGYDPFLIFEAKGLDNYLITNTSRNYLKGNPLELLKELLLKYKTDLKHSDLPFLGGLMGYFSYDLNWLIEEIPQNNNDDIQLNDIVFGFYNKIIIFDHIKNELYCVGSSLSVDTSDDSYNLAKDNLEQLKTILKNMNMNKVKETKTSKLQNNEVEISSNFEKESYLKMVETAREYIRNGDIFQVNLSQRFEAKIYSDPSKIYMNLRNVAPAPFSAFVNFNNISIVCSSMERFIKITGSYIESRPIKGTIQRSKDAIEDEILRKTLLNSQKDKAELTMIVDLVRNDLGRVCKIGSVNVKTHAEVEAYTNVFHTVSTVVGLLKDDKGIVDCIYAAFPGGSITGAPKVRAMEIINELEPIKRNIYTGSIGYIDFNGNSDLNIVIRTILIKENKAYYNVGGGIVWDSEPESEFEETMHKGKMMMKVIKEA